MPSVNSVCVCCGCCSVAKSCPTLFDPMGCSTSASSALRCLPEFAQIHVHWVSDAISVYTFLYNLGLAFRIEVAYSGATWECGFLKACGYHSKPALLTFRNVSWERQSSTWLPACLPTMVTSKWGNCWWYLFSHLLYLVYF